MSEESEIKKLRERVVALEEGQRKQPSEAWKLFNEFIVEPARENKTLLGWLLLLLFFRLVSYFGL